MLKVNFDTAARVDIVVRAGDDFSLVIKAKDSLGVNLDLTGYSGRMHIKTEKSDTIAILEMSGTDFVFENGQFKILKPAVDMQIAPGLYYYDVEITDVTNKVKTWLCGLFTVNEDITR